MAKEELEKEAEKKYFNHKFSDFQGFYNRHYYYLGYLDSAEPREKRIAELEKENAELKDKLEILISVGNTCTKGLHKQLTKAKEIIKDYMTIAKGSHITVCGVPEENRTIYVLKLNEEAEQFLNGEVEK